METRPTRGVTDESQNSTSAPMADKRTVRLIGIKLKRSIDIGWVEGASRAATAPCQAFPGLLSLPLGRGEDITISQIRRS